MGIKWSGAGRHLKRAYPFFIFSLVISPIAQFIVFPAAPALATDNCTAALYSTSDSTTGSSATSNQTAVEVGVKFTPAFATTATAVRFYRSVADTGGYSVHLWDSDGNLLGSGTDTTATGTGWISINLDSPVSLTAGTTYISSYHAAHGQEQVSSGANAADGGNPMISTPSDGGVYDTSTTDTLNPTADTYVNSASPTTNYGTATALNTTSQVNRSLLRFSTSGVVPAGKVVTGATLKVYVTNIAVTTGGFEAHPELDFWTESGATWNNQPTWDTTALATSSTPTTGSWATVALPASAVSLTGNTSLGLRYTADNSNAAIASREDSSHKPQLTITYGETSVTSTFHPTEDTYASNSSAGTNYGSSNPLKATSSQYRTFLRFNTDSVVPAGYSVTSATLRLYVTNNAVTTGGFEVHPEADTWTESGATWSNQPAWDSNVWVTSSTPTAGSWVTISLPAAAVTPNGNTSLGLRYTADFSNATFASREDSSYKPELSITYAPGNTLIASADTYVNSSSPDTNYGTITSLNTTSQVNRSFYRFNTAGAVPSGHSLTGATLKVYVKNDAVTTGGFEVHPETDTWNESGVTWNNQPSWDSTVLGTSGTPTTGTWVSISLPVTAINTSGNTSLGLRYTVDYSNGILASREDSIHQPQLSLTYATQATFTSTQDGYYVSPVLTYTDTTAPPAPTNVTPSVGPNSVTLNWDQDLDTQDSNVAVAKSYTVYRDNTQIGTTNSDTTVFNDNGLDTGTYTYKVTATDYCGNTSDDSADAPATISDEMLFPGGGTPSATTADDPNPTTVGVQFTSATPAEVNGVQFYRAEAVGDGAKIGVWDPDGNLVESGDVADTDTTGWVTTLFQDPVKIKADTTYTVGYYTPAGNYSYTTLGLYSPVTHGNLTALASGGVLHSGTGMVLGSSTSDNNYYVSPVTGPPQPGGVTAGDIIFVQQPTYGPTTIEHLDSATGAVMDLSADNSGIYDFTYGFGDDFTPSISEDGSKIVYIGIRPAYTAGSLITMNSDGSGQKVLDPSTSSTIHYDATPSWSPDGTSIIYSYTPYPFDGSTDVQKATLDSDGNIDSTTSLTSDAANFDPAWSPDGTKVVFANFDSSTGEYQLYIMNSDGSNPQLVGGADSTYGDYAPTWAPDGQRIYFTSSEGSGIWYYSLTNSSIDFTSSNVQRNRLVTTVTNTSETLQGCGCRVGVSADSSTVTFSTTDPSGPNNLPQIWTVPASGGTLTQKTVNDGQHANYTPVFVHHSWASPGQVLGTEASSDGSLVTIHAPKASDAFLHRDITINLSSSGVDHWEFCWSTVGTGTTPDSSCTTHLQSTSGASTSATLDYSTTNPDEDWYLWVKPHNSSTWNGGGSAQKVHTPKRPVWVAVGDSYSSGHHQDGDERFCPAEGDRKLVRFLAACDSTGSPHVTPNDYANFSWVANAADSVSDSAPSQWNIEKINLADSGLATSSFGNNSPTSVLGAAGVSAGSDAWATSGTPAGGLRTELYKRSDSWNFVSMSGGADDTNWVDVMTDWYEGHFTASYGPWNVPTRPDCPLTDSVFASLNTVDKQIITNLDGVVALAHRASPGVRVLNLGYPYTVDSTNTCYGNTSSSETPTKGQKAVIDQLNNDHKSVLGRNVRYVGLVSAFGLSPASSGHLQLTRLYGYPHPSGASTSDANGSGTDGQELIAAAAVSVAAGNGW